VSPFQDLKMGVHAIAICYLAELSDKNAPIHLDETHKKHKWIEGTEEDIDSLDPYVKKVLEDAKIW